MINTYNIHDDYLSMSLLASLFVSFSSYLSIFLSLSFYHSSVLSIAAYLPITHSLFLCLSLLFILSSLFFSLLLFLLHSLTLTFTPSYLHSLLPSLSLTFTHSYLHSLSPPLTLTFTPSHLHSLLFSLPLTFTHSYINILFNCSLAGQIGWIVSIAPDVVKSTIQTSDRPLGIIETTKQIIAARGVRGLFAGIEVREFIGKSTWQIFTNLGFYRLRFCVAFDLVEAERIQILFDFSSFNFIISVNTMQFSTSYVSFKLMKFYVKVAVIRAFPANAALFVGYELTRKLLPW